MQYKIISDSVQEFNGAKFHIGTNGYFYKTLGSNQKQIRNKSRESMHRFVWEFYNGSIPKGFIVHHKDEKKDNNNIENLILMDKKDHRKMHSIQFHKDNPEHSRKTIEKIQSKCKEWHKSEDGRKWHKENFEKNGHMLYKKGIFICEVCKKEYEGVQRGENRNKYCSDKCASKARRDSGIDNEERKCHNCGKLFTINKYRKTKCCCKHCAQRLRFS